MCGLKLIFEEQTLSLSESHPAWVCGLKLISVMVFVIGSGVTPCVGVWIETHNIMY